VCSYLHARMPNKGLVSPRSSRPRRIAFCMALIATQGEGVHRLRCCRLTPPGDCALNVAPNEMQGFGSVHVRSS
jgi:hypothetical protein